MKVYLWQKLYTIHRSSLVRGLCDAGVSVTIVAERIDSKERKNLGWEAPDLSGVEFLIAGTFGKCLDIIESSPVNSFHLCGGFRHNGVFEKVIKELISRGLDVFVMLESVDDSGFKGILRRILYSRYLRQYFPKLSGILATGARTKELLVDLGAEPNKVFPFTYFLHEPIVRSISSIQLKESPRFRFAFVGQFIARKNLNLLISALGAINNQDFELVVAGSGPLEDELRLNAEKLIPGKHYWMGVMPSNQIASLLANVDCLVLPSRFDGWGAVVTEALMVGTPAVCSDGCGAAEAVSASGVGGVFRAGDQSDLLKHLQLVLTSGRIDEGLRSSLSDWSKNFSGSAGAAYLLEIFRYVKDSGEFPTPPWRRISL